MGMRAQGDLFLERTCTRVHRHTQIHIFLERERERCTKNLARLVYQVKTPESPSSLFLATAARMHDGKKKVNRDVRGGYCRG